MDENISIGIKFERSLGILNFYSNPSNPENRSLWTFSHNSLVFQPAESHCSFFFLLHNQIDEIRTHAERQKNQRPVQNALSTYFKYKLFSMIPLQHFLVCSHCSIGDRDQRSVSKLLYWTKFHKVPGILQLNSPRNADIDHKTMSCFIEIFGLRVQKLFELQRVIFYDWLFFFISIEIYLCPIFA